ncbi:MAG: hypothetical protein WA156_00455, partial [Methylocystis silviterrae]
MRKTLSAFILVTALLAVGAAKVAKAADPAPLVLKAPPPILAASPWRVEFGTRYWFSSGNHKYDYYDAQVPGLLISRLTFGDLTGHSAETFFRVDHESGV